MPRDYLFANGVFVSPKIWKVAIRSFAVIPALVLFCFSSSHCIRAAEGEGQTPALTVDGGVPKHKPGEPSVILNQGHYCVVYSYDPKSASYVANLGNILGRWFEMELKWNSPLADRPVRVELIPRTEVTWTDPYRLNENGGQITLWVLWGNDTDWETLTRALAHAFIARAFQASGSSRPSDTIPNWLVAALARELIAQTQPALLEAWTREAIQKKPLSLETFTTEPQRAPLAPVQITDSDYPLHAFWFWRHLRREVSPNRNLLLTLAQGVSLDSILNQVKPDVWKNPERKTLWWPVGYQQILRERTPTSMSLSESREYLADAARFVFAIDGSDKRFLASELIAIRDLPAVKQEVALRQRLLKLNISRANIVWHNAWRSYGVFLEKFPTASEAELHRLWANAQSDAAEATILEHEINRALAK